MKRFENDICLLESSKINTKTLNWFIDLTFLNMKKFVKGNILKFAKKRSLSNPKNYFLVSFKSQDPCGFLMYRIDENLNNQKNKNFFIYEIQVSLQYQRHGIGSTLLMNFIKNILEINDVVSLCVYKSNEVAMSFYEKFGFQYIKEENEENIKYMTYKKTGIIVK